MGKQTGVPKGTGLCSRAEMRPLPSSSLCQGAWGLCPQSIWAFSLEDFLSLRKGLSSAVGVREGLWCGDAVL